MIIRGYFIVLFYMLLAQTNLKAQIANNRADFFVTGYIIEITHMERHHSPSGFYFLEIIEKQELTSFPTILFKGEYYRLRKLGLLSEKMLLFCCEFGKEWIGTDVVIDSVMLNRYNNEYGKACGLVSKYWFDYRENDTKFFNFSSYFRLSKYKFKSIKAVIKYCECEEAPFFRRFEQPESGDFISIRALNSAQVPTKQEAKVLKRATKKLLKKRLANRPFEYD